MRGFQSSGSRQSGLVLGGLALLLGASVAQVGVRAYEARALRKQQEAEQQPEPAKEEPAREEPVRERKAGAEEGKGAAPGWMDQWFAKRFYDGGFEDKMTKREAALILGVRESSPLDKVKAAHRRILMLNHPDRGGSPFIASKVNEAKDLLLKGREE